jgi:GT2 family glycosyltransferase
MTPVGSIRLLVASAGNEFMLDIARIFAEGVSENGVACAVAIDQPPSDGDHPGELQIVVAPHEYFPLFIEKHFSRSARKAMLRGTYVLNVEQPGSQWFELACGYARRASGILDISRSGAEEFARRGLRAWHVPLAYAACMRADAIPDIPERPIDLLFLGHQSPRREWFLSSHADLFARYRCRFILADVTRPRHRATPGYYAGQERSRLVAASKILLNVHSTDRPYFEAHRALLAIANGCLLISESSKFTEPLVNREHFIMSLLDELPSLCAFYLEHLDKLEAITARAREFVLETHSAARICGDLLRTLEAAPAAPPVRPALVGLAPLPPAASEPARREAVVGRIELARARRATGEPVWDTVTNSPYPTAAPPSVSVIVTLYNYAHHVNECLASVGRTDPSALPHGFEVVVVEDASTDHSAQVVERFMQDADFPLLLVKKRVNTGLADARNIGIELARAPYVFVLDADNWIYPSCLPSLFQALLDSDCAAAYGLISRFDDATGQRRGLLSIYEWSVPALLRGPYIDAMAMFRCDVLREIGGYALELIRYGWFGWEDYDLWLTLAQAGHRCQLVPEILSSYREHPSSMIHATNRTAAEIAKYFHTKFAPLIQQYPDLDQYFGFPRSPAGAPTLMPAADPDPPDPERMHYAELERRLAGVYASMSWRITAPLRFAYRVLRGWR